MSIPLIIGFLLGCLAYSIADRLGLGSMWGRLRDALRSARRYLGGE